MPNIRIHEEVAYIFAKKYNEYDNRDFYLGVLSPDAVNLEGFGSKKERWLAHQRDKNYYIWRDNIIKFYNDNKDNYNKYFIFGYLFHVITDIVYDEFFYLKVREKILEDGIELEDSHNVMRDDMDKYMFRNYDYITSKLKEKNKYYSILNIDEERLEKWTKKNLIDIEITNSRYINKELIIELEEQVESEILKIG